MRHAECTQSKDEIKQTRTHDLYVSSVYTGGHVCNKLFSLALDKTHAILKIQFATMSFHLCEACIFYILKMSVNTGVVCNTIYINCDVLICSPLPYRMVYIWCAEQNTRLKYQHQLIDRFIYHMSLLFSRWWCIHIICANMLRYLVNLDMDMMRRFNLFDSRSYSCKFARYYI